MRSQHLLSSIPQSQHKLNKEKDSPNLSQAKNRNHRTETVLADEVVNLMMRGRFKLHRIT